MADQTNPAVPAATLDETLNTQEQRNGISSTSTPEQVNSETPATAPDDALGDQEQRNPNPLTLSLQQVNGATGTNVLEQALGPQDQDQDSSASSVDQYNIATPETVPEEALNTPEQRDYSSSASSPLQVNGHGPTVPRETPAPQQQHAGSSPSTSPNQINGQGQTAPPNSPALQQDIGSSSSSVPNQINGVGPNIPEEGDALERYLRRSSTAASLTQVDNHDANALADALVAAFAEFPALTRQPARSSSGPPLNQVNGHGHTIHQEALAPHNQQARSSSGPLLNQPNGQAHTVPQEALASQNQRARSLSTFPVPQVNGQAPFLPVRAAAVQTQHERSLSASSLDHVNGQNTSEAIRNLVNDQAASGSSRTGTAAYNQAAPRAPPNTPRNQALAPVMTDNYNLEHFFEHLFDEAPASGPSRASSTHSEFGPDSDISEFNLDPESNNEAPEMNGAHDTEEDAPAAGPVNQTGLRRVSGFVDLPSLAADPAPAAAAALPWADTPTWGFENVPAPVVANPANGEEGRLRRAAPAGNLRALALRQEAPAAPPIEGDEGAVVGVVGGGVVGGGGAPAQEEDEEEEVAVVVEGEEEEEEEDEEDEEGAERVNLDEVDAPVADRIRAGLVLLNEARQEVDVLDVAVPMVDFRGHPAAIRARANLLVASGEVQAAVGMLWRSLVEARGTAADALEGNWRLRDEAQRLATEIVALQLQAGTWRDEALALRARLGEEGGN